VLLAQPREYIIAQSNGKLVHFTRLPLGNNAGRLIASDVAFLAEVFEAATLAAGQPIVSARL